MDDAAAAKLAKFNAQFQRSDPSPEKENSGPKMVLDGGAVLDKFAAGGAGPKDMSGAEYYAMLGHIKRQQGGKGEALENELMKISRQLDKKIRLLDWVGQHLAAPPPSAPLQQHVPASPAAPAAPPPVMQDLPAAGTPSSRQPRNDGGMARMDMPPMAKLDLGSAMGEERVPGERPQTARARTAMLGGGGMADLLGSTTPRDVPQTARPGVSSGGGAAPPAAAPVMDMSACIEEFRSGKDHLKMSGGEYYGILGFLKAHGHSDLEGDLLKVRTMGDKKLHLVRYLKEKCAGLGGSLGGGAAEPQDVSDHAHYAPQQPQLAPPMPPPQQPAPQMMGGAQVMPIHHPAAPAPQMVPQMAPTHPALAAQQQAIAQAVATIQQAGGLPGGNGMELTKSVLALEGIITRLDESFSFAVECMQTDMAHAKNELAKLKAMLPA